VGCGLKKRRQHVLADLPHQIGAQRLRKAFAGMLLNRDDIGTIDIPLAVTSSRKLSGPASPGLVSPALRLMRYRFVSGHESTFMLTDVLGKVCANVSVIG
jgi:hypothetical protein